MELERRDIERTDFPQARRGYDPAAVDRHLRAIADAVEELKSARAQSSSSLAGAAAERVEAIVAAAEASAREIEERARADADRIRAEAEQTAAERVSGSQQVVTQLEERAQTLLGEVDDFVTRVGGLRSALEEISAEAAAKPGEVPAPAEPAEPEPPAPAPAPEPAPAASVPSSGSSSSGSSEGARLVALNMALSGTPREETARYLRENFDLNDQDELLDDVYARAGS